MTVLIFYNANAVKAIL